MYKHILVPTDGSKLSRDASLAAVQLARALGARITGFFAAPPATPIIFKGLLPAGYATPEEHEQNIRKAAQDYLGAIEKAAKSAGVPCQVMTVTSDYPAEAIVAAAQKRRCDLIFMASHGRRGLRHDSLLGSETQKVLAQAPLPVLVHRETSSLRSRAIIAGHGHIGIVACSAEGAALCYRTICTEGPGLLGAAHAHPEVSMHTHSLAEYMELIYRGDWEGVGGLMLSSARKLAGLGASFLICPDNTLHQALPYVTPRSPLPWLHIAEIVTAEAAARNFRRLGLTGTRWLMEGPVYPKELVRPDAAERAEINRIIMDELVCGVFRPQALHYFQSVIARMKDAGCDAVVLGCTEIPLIVDDSSSPLPTLDSTRLLARAALARACAA